MGLHQEFSVEEAAPLFHALLRLVKDHVLADLYTLLCSYDENLLGRRVLVVRDWVRDLRAAPLFYLDCLGLGPRFGRRAWEENISRTLS